MIHKKSIVLPRLTNERDDNVLDVDGGLELGTCLQEAGQRRQMELVRENLHQLVSCSLSFSTKFSSLL
jgi:hypothetical protein